jgi:hypothetical protein
MDIVQFITLLISFFGGIGYIHKEFKEFKNEIRADMQKQTDRTDKLYQMFIDLLKEKK